MRGSSSAELLHEALHLLRRGVGQGLREHQQPHRVLELLELLRELGRDLVGDERHRREYSIRVLRDPSDPAREPGPGLQSAQERAKNHEEGTGSPVRRGTKSGR